MDTFTFLMPCSGSDEPYFAWLPSGEHIAFDTQPGRYYDGLGHEHAPRPGAWHQVDIYLDWEAMKCLFLLDGHTDTAAEDPYDTQASWKDFTHPATAPGLMQNGFTYLYLFTWREDDTQPSPPEVCFADIWFEDTHDDDWIQYCEPEYFDASDSPESLWYDDADGANTASSDFASGGESEGDSDGEEL